MASRITINNLHNCVIDYLQLNCVLGNLTTTGVRDMLIDSIVNLYNSNNSVLQQLHLNSLIELRIIKYIDDSNVSCNTADELFEADLQRIQSAQQLTTANVTGQLATPGRRPVEIDDDCPF